MCAAMQIAQAVEPLDGQGEGDQQPSNEQAAGIMMAEMFQPVAIFGIVEALILNLPATLGQAEKGATAELAGGKIGQPIGLDPRAVGSRLAIAEDAHRFPTQGFPGIKVIRVQISIRSEPWWRTVVGG